jgi:hypothetical protein
MTDDRYNTLNTFRREVFAVALHYLESESLTEKGVVCGLKSCIEFFVGGADNDTIRDFCVAKLHEAEQRMR